MKEIHTYVSRLRGLWNHIRGSRNRFEDRPELSIIPKGVGRFFNRLWNWGIKFTFGIIILGFGQPILTLLNLVLTIVLFFTLPAIIPVLSVVGYLISMLIYDFWSDKVNPLPILKCLIWKFLIKGVLFLILEIITIAFLILASLFVTVVGAILNGLKWIWDTLMYLTVVRLLKVPGKEDILAKKISGPGVSSTVYYQIKLPVAKLLLQMYLENLELSHIASFEKDVVNQNISDFKEKMNHLLIPLGFSINSNSYLVKKQERCNEVKKEIDEQVKLRKEELMIVTNIKNKDKVRMRSNDLMRFLSDATHIVKNFYEERLLDRFEEPKDVLENAFGNWSTVTKDILVNIFSDSFLVSLEDIDEQGFRLVKNEKDFTDFAKSIYENDYNNEGVDGYIDSSITFYNRFKLDDTVSFCSPFDESLKVYKFVNPSKKMLKEGINK